jgi:cytidylate kinase
VIARGKNTTLDEVLRETLQRDDIDKGRETAPLRAAVDAIRIDTNDMEIDEVVAEIEALARSRQLLDSGRPWPT